MRWLFRVATFVRFNAQRGPSSKRRRQSARSQVQSGVRIASTLGMRRGDGPNGGNLVASTARGLACCFWYHDELGRKLNEYSLVSQIILVPRLRHSRSDPNPRASRIVRRSRQPGRPHSVVIRPPVLMALPVRRCIMTHGGKFFVLSFRDETGEVCHPSRRLGEARHTSPLRRATALSSGFSSCRPLAVVSSKLLRRERHDVSRVQDRLARDLVQRGDEHESGSESDGPLQGPGWLASWWRLRRLCLICQLVCAEANDKLDG